jgi:class 3 adenylate cyclase
MAESTAGTYPLPDDPLLSQAAAAVRDAGHWAWVVDPSWTLVYLTDALRLSFGGGTLAELSLGGHLVGPELVAEFGRLPYGATATAMAEDLLHACGGAMLAAAGDRESLKAMIAPELRHLVDELEPDYRTVAFSETRGVDLGGAITLPIVSVRLRDDSGRLAGTLLIMKPAASMATLASVITQSDPGHLDQMHQVARAARRPAAILFADLEGSTDLSRRLSTANYFALGRRLVRAADRCVIDAGGIVGRHVGDGVVAFFLAESLGSESAAARACIETARALREAVAEVARRSGLEPESVGLRFGLHWGSTLYVGSISTAGRNEVTALGDEVNEGARIEACAAGQRALASKAIVERLDAADAAAVGLDPDRITYTTLGDVATATEKARRDAPSIAICEI